MLTRFRSAWHLAVLACVSLFLPLSVLLPASTASAAEATEWQSLVSQAAQGGDISINGDITAPTDGEPLVVPSGTSVTLTGAGTLTGLGAGSVVVEESASLTLAGPAVTNAQFLVNGDMSFTAGSITNTSLIGPIIFVNTGTLTVDGTAEFSGNSVATEGTPTPTTVKGNNYAPITAYGGTVTINGGTISGNQGYRQGGAIGVWGSDAAPATLNLVGGVIKNNVVVHPRLSGLGGGVFAQNAQINLSGSTISENVTEIGGGFIVLGGSFTMTGGLIDANHNGEYQGRGGGILLDSVQTTISGGVISNNTANGDGGGVYVDQGSISITEGVVSNNTAIGSGGGVHLESGALVMSGGRVTGNEAASNSDGFGGGIHVVNGTAAISGGEFTDNKAMLSGGGVAFMTSDRLPVAENGPSATITAAYIANNEAQGYNGGGGIYNHFFAHVTIHNAVVRDNSMERMRLIGAGEHPPSAQGGGVWNCQAGSTTMHITKGVAMYDNAAPNAGKDGQYLGAGDDFASVSRHWHNNPNPSEGESVSISERMLGGGERLWYQDGSIQNLRTNWRQDQQNLLLPRYSHDAQAEPIPYHTPINVNKAFKSVPSSDSKDAAARMATVVIEDNRATSFAISGGGIANNGELVFGEDDTWTLTVKKEWEADDPAARPTTITVDVLVGESKVDQVTLSQDNNWTADVTAFPNPATLIDAQTGELVPITFKESGADGYTLAVADPVIDEQGKVYSFTLTNRLLTSVPVSKVWDDADNKDGIRPDSITVELLADDQPTGQQLVLGAETDWAGAFVDLPQYANWVRVNYSIRELPVDGYEASITGDQSTGFTVTNRHEPTPPPKPKPKNLPKTGI